MKTRVSLKKGVWPTLIKTAFLLSSSVTFATTTHELALKCNEIFTDVKTESANEELETLSHYESGFTTAPPSDLFRQLDKQNKRFIVNSGNPGKQREFQEMFGPLVHEVLELDKKEIVSDYISVVVHKASQFKDTKHPVLVDDTILDVEDADVGINIRWFVESGEILNHVGKKAVWTTTLAYRDGDNVYLASGKIEGIIVRPEPFLNKVAPALREEVIARSFGFDLYFIPNGETFPVGFNKVPKNNPRWHAAKKIMIESVRKYDVIEEWDGAWQNE